MKEIEIRAWNEDNKQMVYYPPIKAGEVFDEYVVGEPLLFIGEKDKNRKKIFEGDNVKFKRPFWDIHGECEVKEVIETVKWKDGGFSANNYQADMFDIEWKDMEVVSNICENSENTILT